MNLSVRAFHTEMKQLGKFPQRDFDVLVHGDSKWHQFSKYIDWKGKRVHDVGCHIGLVSMRAKEAGARYVLGTDKRQDVVDFNNAIAIKFLPVNKGKLGIKFKQGEMGGTTTKSDIVLCLGVIHKFDNGIYQKMVEYLCNMCKNTLVIETVFDYSEKQDLNVRKHPDPKSPWPYLSRASKPYLRKLLKENGFTATKEIPSVVYHHHQRETWIAVRDK